MIRLPGQRCYAQRRKARHFPAGGNDPYHRDSQRRTEMHRGDPGSFCASSVEFSVVEQSDIRLEMVKCEYAANPAWVCWRSDRLPRTMCGRSTGIRKVKRRSVERKREPESGEMYPEAAGALLFCFSGSFREVGVTADSLRCFLSFFPWRQGDLDGHGPGFGQFPGGGAGLGWSTWSWFCDTCHWLDAISLTVQQPHYIGQRLTRSLPVNIILAPHQST